MSRSLVAVVVAAMLAFAMAVARAATPAVVSFSAEVADEPATLRVLNRDIVTFRAHFGTVTPQLRVERAIARLRELPTEAMELPIGAIPFASGDVKGVQFQLGDEPLFVIVEADVNAESKQKFNALVKQTLAHLEEARAAWHDLRDVPLLLQGLLRTVIATAVLAALIWATWRFSRKVVGRMEVWRDMLAAAHSHVDWREFLARLAVGVAQSAQWFVLLALGYFWIYFVLGSFVATMPVAASLGSWLWGKAAWVATGVVEGLPGVATAVIVLAVTRAVADVTHYFFGAVQTGRLRVPWFHPDTVTATRRIVSLVVWGVGLAIAYPYLPGSSSDAFKGISVLFGLMITLGSSGIVTQAMSGLVLIYSRALRKGDFVDVNGVQGVVTEVASLATKIVTVRNEEITIPNSVVISSPIRNYSRLGGAQGAMMSTTVTIGYDAPWRQVHELLIAAARATPHVRAAPEPYVLQRALSDFYVEYELFCSIDEAARRIPIMSDLHAAIQDTFNEAGVQIMSPHFRAQPEEAVVVPKSKWYAAPARKP